MIIYNVTISIRPDLEGEVLAWLKNEHIPEILETGLFVEHHMEPNLHKENNRRCRKWNDNQKDTLDIYSTSQLNWYS